MTEEVIPKGKPVAIDAKRWVILPALVQIEKNVISVKGKAIDTLHVPISQKTS